MKQCCDCKEEKDEDCFWKSRSRSDGRQSLCKPCQARANNKVRDAKRQAVYAYLQTHPCVDCKQTNPILLEFDHVRGTKYDCVSVLISRGVTLERIFSEIEKCEVRCLYCHRIKTVQQLGQLPWLGIVPPQAIQ